MAVTKADALTEFTKTKMHFALAMLATLFTLHPFIEKWGDKGFKYPYIDFPLQVYYVYGLVAGLLAFTVYCYALSLLSERGYSWVEKAGNYSYAIAIMVVPLYGGLYLSTLLAEQVGRHEVAVQAPAIAVGLGIAWLLASYLLARRLRKRLGEQDRTAKVEQLAEQEIVALNRAQELFTSGHFDLSVIESWKAIEARLRRVLMLRGISASTDDPESMVRAASRAHILSKPALELLQELRRQWNVAVSTEPLTRDAALTALNATRNILSTIQLEDPKTKVKPTI